MLEILDTWDRLFECFDRKLFSLEKWRNYAESISPELKEKVLKDSAEYDFQRDILPVFQTLISKKEQAVIAHDSFVNVVSGLDERLKKKLGFQPDLKIIFYLGMCNGAGWAVAAGGTAFGGRAKVLLGIEEILELDWTSLQDLQGLVYHELGHLYHSQHGELRQEVPAGPARFVWQLFTEGAAMCFEQMLAGDMEFYHQDKNGWKAWCQEHFLAALQDFDQDLPAMTQADQRYFGDWVRYRGRGDVGYYLGARWVQSLLRRCHFNEIIQLPVEAVCARYREYVQEMLGIKSSLPR